MSLSCSFMFKESAAPHKAFCYTWSEIIGQWRSCEIIAAMSRIMHFNRHVINEVSLFSDIVAARTKISTLLSLCDVQNTHL